MKFRIITIIAVLFSLSVVQAQIKKVMQPEDLYKIKKISGVTVSPDGSKLAFTVSEPSIKKNSYNSDVWIINTNGSDLYKLTNSEHSDKSPQWLPDGSTIAFLSNRDGNSNIYLISTLGGEAKQLTHSENNLSKIIVSKNGSKIICYSRVLPKGKTNLENWTKEELPDCEVRSIDHLLFRQWDRWLGDKRNHIFVVDIKTGEVTEATPEDYDSPPVTLSASHDYDISPDGKEICYVKDIDEVTSFSTNHDLFIRDIETLTETKITNNPAYDSNPHYSPDGKYIAYVSMNTPGYESDRRFLTVYDRISKTSNQISSSLDASPNNIKWSEDSKNIFFTARHKGSSAVFRTDLNGNIKVLTHDGYNVSLSSGNTDNIFMVRSYNHQPDEIFSISLQDNKNKRLTSFNKSFCDEFQLPQLEEFWFAGADGDSVHGFIQKPPYFNPNKKYPVVLGIHGGPQGMWADRFMTTWLTFPLLSSKGYVTVLINPRGSSGYGSKFREQVSRDYGGRCYEDLMKGLDYAIENYNFIDKSRQAAIGGSFGGYSVNWIMGHTNRFKCIVSHASLFNTKSFFGATEELFYASWDLGDSPWEDSDLFEKWSPSNFVNNFQTPTLVTHGLNDYRVPFGESLQLFTALQMEKIPSRLVTIPGEGHVISSPQNNIRWWKEIQRWFELYL